MAWFSKGNYMRTDQVNKTKISFHFHPYQFDQKNHTVEKADSSGKQRRYVTGISSGLKLDQHQERMTDKCIKSFMEQANSGDVLLYPDLHGIKPSEDIGILEKAELTPTHDWFTEYRLYDESDGIGTNKAETINTLWKQINGLPPYQKPRQKGFSIEGYIPDDELLSFEADAAGNIGKRVINDVQLDGVLLVNRPAYADSIATAVYKALGELMPERVDNIRKSMQTALRDRVRQDEIRDSYYRKKWDIQDAMESEVERLMKNTDPNKREKLEILFSEHGSLMIELIMNSESLFLPEEDEGQDVLSPYGSTAPVIGKGSRLDVYKSLVVELKKYSTLLKGEIR
jgi:hypothetical protein